MRRPNINVTVSGPLRDAALYQYKTVILKAALPCADQVTQPYTKYVIKWDFDLGGQTVTVPENCILEFDGGSLKNGTIIGQDTLFINVGDVEIWGEGLVREGTWREHSGGTKQVQADWEQEDQTKPDYIKNKPDIQRISVAGDENKRNIILVNARLAEDESSTESADALLRTAIQAEKDARILGESELSDDISSESQARITKDDEHDTRIASLQTAVNNRYTKSEVDSLISRTPETNVVIVEGQEGVDPVTLLPSTGEANTLYRIMSASGDSFSEYGWDGTNYVLLSIGFHGIESTPTPNSNKFLTSDGVAKSLGICDIQTIDSYPYGVKTWFVLTNNAKSVKVKTNRPNSPNSEYLYQWTVVSSDELKYTFTDVTPEDPLFVARVLMDKSKREDNSMADLSKYNNAVAVAFHIAEVNIQTLSYNTLSANDFEGYYVEIVDAESELLLYRRENNCILRNGSNGNTANLNAVCTYWTPVGMADLVTFETDRPNSQNCRYSIAWYSLLSNDYDYTYKSALDVPSQYLGPIIDYNKETVRSSFDLRQHSDIKSVACSIVEYNYVTNSYNPLRIEDFNGYYFKIVKRNVESTIYKKEEDSLTIRNGTTNNMGNTNCVATEYVGIGNSRYLTVTTTRPNKQNCQYVYGWTVSKLATDFHTDQQYVDDNNHFSHQIETSRRNNTIDLLNNDYVDYSEYKYIAFSIGEYNILTRSYSPLRVEDFVGYEIKVIRSEYIEPIIDHVLNGDSVVKCVLRNGSTGNPGNANAVSTFLVPTLNFAYFELKTTRPNSVGYHYTYTFDFSASAHGDNGSSDFNEERTEYLDQQFGVAKFVRTLSKSRGIQMAIWERSDADNSYHPLRVSDFDGYEVYIIRRGVFGASTLASCNQDKLPLLTAASRYFKDWGIDDFQALLITDVHGDEPVIQRDIEGVDELDTVNVLINLGDTVSDWMAVNNPNYSIWRDKVRNCIKPFYCVIGNHEAGNYTPVCGTPTDEDLYNAFIKPSVDAGHLVAGEYTLNKCYYFHDFITHKIRLIVLNEFEVPLIFDETDWTPIPYNSELPKIAWNTSYTAGTEVNDIYYTEHSFRAVRNVTTASGMNDAGSGMPRYKYARARRWMSQQQAQWFLNTLLATPAGYKVIVALHTPYSDNAGVMQNAKFSQKGIYVDGYPNSFNYYVNDFIADALDAFQRGVVFTANCVSKYPNDIPGYSVSANFANKNIDVTLHSILAGHEHKDFVWKHLTYNQYQITPICGITYYAPSSGGADIRRAISYQSREKFVDSVTVVTFKNDKAILVKLGVDVTEDFEKRDFEIINI